MPDINIHIGESSLAETLAAIAERQIHVVPPTVEVTVNPTPVENIVNPTPVEVTVNPEVRAPDVHVAPAAAPKVENVVNLPAPAEPEPLVASESSSGPRRITFERWPDGKIRAAIVEDVKE